MTDILQDQLNSSPASGADAIVDLLENDIKKLEDENGKISPDWRFSLVQMNYKQEIVEDENGNKKRKITTERQ